MEKPGAPRVDLLLDRPRRVWHSVPFIDDHRVFKSRHEAGPVIAGRREDRA
jgi:hypothetical protein